jgi:hypothetical protein
VPQQARLAPQQARLEPVLLQRVQAEPCRAS